MAQRPYEKLIVWKEVYALCLWIYKITAKFPKHEIFGLRSQLRRAAYSVPFNIVEGNRKKHKKEKNQFFERSAASLEEVHCAARLAVDLEYITKSEFIKTDDRIQRISYLLTKLINSHK